MKSIIQDFVVIRVLDNVFNSEVNLKGDSRKLLVDVTFNPERHIKCCGEVMAVPGILSEYPIAGVSMSHGKPAYYDSVPRYIARRLSNIAMEVRVGDRIYFHYNCLLPDDQSSRYNFWYLNSERVLINGEKRVYHYFRIRYDNIFAAVRYEPMNNACKKFEWIDEPNLVQSQVADHGEMQTVYHLGENSYKKQVQMIGSYILVQPDKESWEDISIPVPEVINGKVLRDISGQVIYKPKDKWLVTKSAPGNRPLSGWVLHVGTPLKNDYADIHVGDYVYFQRATDTTLVFEGQEIWRLRQRHVTFINPGLSRGLSKAS